MLPATLPTILADAGSGYKRLGDDEPAPSALRAKWRDLLGPMKWIIFATSFMHYRFWVSNAVGYRLLVGSPVFPQIFGEIPEDDWVPSFAEDWIMGWIVGATAPAIAYLILARPSPSVWGLAILWTAFGATDLLESFFKSIVVALDAPVFTTFLAINAAMHVSSLFLLFQPAQYESHFGIIPLTSEADPLKWRELSGPMKWIIFASAFMHHRFWLSSIVFFRLLVGSPLLPHFPDEIPEYDWVPAFANSWIVGLSAPAIAFFILRRPCPPIWALAILWTTFGATDLVESFFRALLHPYGALPAAGLTEPVFAAFLATNAAVQISSLLVLFLPAQLPQYHGHFL